MEPIQFEDEAYLGIEDEVGLASVHETSTEEIMPGIRPIWAPELKQMDIPPPSWIVDQFVSAGGISLLSSMPGTYKTMLAIEIAKCVAQGAPLFGVFETTQTKVLILDEESGNGRLKKRQAILGADESDIASFSFANIKMSQEYSEAIVKYCKANSIGLVIFDSLTRFHAAQENASQEMSEVLSYFHLVAKEGIAVLVIHHDTKRGYKRPDSSNTLRGSGDILAISDVHIVLQKHKNASNKIIVKQLKNRDDEPMDDLELVVHSNDDRTRLWFEYAGDAPKLISDDQRVDDVIIALLDERGRMFQGEIIEALRSVAGEKKIAERLVQMDTAEGRLECFKGAHGRKYYELALEQSDE